VSGSIESGEFVCRGARRRALAACLGEGYAIDSPSRISAPIAIGGGGKGRRRWREWGWTRDDGGEALAELLASAIGGI
jgi:hypothetical protein